MLLLFSFFFGDWLEFGAPWNLLAGLALLAFRAIECICKVNLPETQLLLACCWTGVVFSSYVLRARLDSLGVYVQSGIQALWCMYVCMYVWRRLEWLGVLAR